MTDFRLSPSSEVVESWRAVAVFCSLEVVVNVVEVRSELLLTGEDFSYRSKARTVTRVGSAALDDRSCSMEDIPVLFCRSD